MLSWTSALGVRSPGFSRPGDSANESSAEPPEGGTPNNSTAGFIRPRPIGSYFMLPVTRIRSRETRSAAQRSASSFSGTQTKSRSRNVGATINRNRRNLFSDLGDKRAFTSAVGIRYPRANATRFGQTSASISKIRAGLITENARRITSQ